MSQFYQYRNALLAADSWVEVLTDNVRLGGLSLTTQAEHLQVGTSSIILDDPDADLGHDGDTILGLHRFELIEDDATDDEHIVISFITDVKFRRGDSDRLSLRTGTQRQIELSLVDLNTIPTLVVIDPDDADAKRPAETIDDRLAWLLASDYLLGRVHDDGVVESNTTMMDAAEYGGQTAANVIGDCELAAGFGWNAWIYYLEDAGHYSLGFINANTSTLYSSDLRISNLLSDLDTLTVSGFESGTTFAPLYEAELTRDYSSVVSGVHVAWSDGDVFRERAATKDIYGPREQTAPDSNIKSATRAASIADDYLFQHSTPADNIHVAIEVPTSKANAIKAGQRLEVKFTHLPGYESFTWCRVIRRTIIQEQATDRYVIDMDLTPQEAAPVVSACVASATPSATYWPLGGGVQSGIGYQPFASDGVVHYWRGGLAIPAVPDLHEIGSWHFGLWGTGGPSSIDWAGDCTGNALILITVGNGQWTIQTEMYGGSTRALEVRLGPEYSNAQWVSYINSGDSVVVTIDDATDGDCIRSTIIKDRGLACGGKWGFSGAVWVAA